MSIQYILNSLQYGGAQLNNLIASNFSDESVKNVIQPETVFSIDNKRIPKIDDEKLKISPTVSEGVLGVRECKLKMTKEMGKKLILAINESIAASKKDLKASITDLQKVHAERMNALYALLKGNQSDKVSDVYEYIDSLETILNTTKKALKANDEDFKQHVNEVLEGYNKDKKGRHPILKEQSSLKEIKNKIFTKFNIKRTITNTERIEKKKFDGIIGKLVIGDKENECDVTSVHIGRGIISVVYTVSSGSTEKHYDKEIYFKNLCILD